MSKKQNKSAKRRDKLMIIDGNALIHRSFHALPPTMTTKSGVMVNAVYGFTTVLLKAIRELKPEYVVLTLDKKGPTFRHKQYKEYKAKRVKAPDELYAQIPIVKKLATAFNIPIFEKTGFEADDLIGTISKKTNENVKNIIVTGDMDTLQLIDDSTEVYTMSRGLSDSVIYDAQAVKTRYSLSVEQMIDYKALRGDPSDNIPGVKGIGEKTATELLQNFKTLDGVYKNIKSKKIKERIQGLLAEHKDDAYLSRDLATIKCDVPINFDLEATRFSNFKKNDVVKFLSDLEFKSLLPRVKDLEAKSEKGDKSASTEASADKFERNKNKFNYQLIDNEKKFKKFLTELKKQSRGLGITFDTETSGIDTLNCDLLGISFSWEKGKSYYVLVKSKKPKAEISNGTNLFNYNKKEKQETKNLWLERLKPIFENPKIKKNAHNMKFDIRVLKNQGIQTMGLSFDTMIASFLLNPGSRQHNLDALTFTELGFEKINKEDLLGKGRDKISFSEVEDEKLSLYSCEDADFTHRLVKKLGVQLKEQALNKLFNEIEMPLVSVLAQMEENGIKINKQFLTNMSKKMSKKIESLEKKIYKQVDQKFNIKSTQQLGDILFNKLQIPAQGIKKTKTGISTAAEELNKIKELHPVIKLIQEYRELTKLTSTYVDALPLLVNKKTKRIHTSFNQAVAATGRLSSSNPNLQNIPIRTNLGKEIRKAFVASSGNSLVSLDYSQIELRLAAHMSDDKKMIKAFLNDADIHTSTAAEINQIKIEDVTKKMRREAKAINFGILYGQGPHGLSQSADISYLRAKEFIEQYFDVYKDVKKYIDKSIEEARQKGYTETMLGRRRFLPEINSSVIMVRKAAERMAMNTPLQGTAADMIKIAMIEIAKLLEKEKETKMLLQVHDELVFEIKNNKIEKIIPEIKKIMEDVVKLKVPVVVDAKTGNNWGTMKKIE